MGELQDSLDEESLLQRQSEDEPSPLGDYSSRQRTRSGFMPKLSTNLSGVLLVVFTNVVLCTLLLKVVAVGSFTTTKTEEEWEYFCKSSESSESPDPRNLG